MITVDKGITEERLAELRAFLPIPEGVPARSVRFAEVEKFVFARITDDRFCFRDSCLTFMGLTGKRPPIYISLFSNGSVFFSDEVFLLTPELDGFVAAVGTGIPNKSIRVFISEASIVVMP
jgi:hypothetical protein